MSLSLSALFKGKNSKNNGDFYCLNCLYLFRTENRLKKHENVFKNHHNCYIEIPKEDSILKYNHGQKFMKALFIIYAHMESLLEKICNHGEKFMKVLFVNYAHMESLLEKIDTCPNNPEKSSTTKMNKQTTSGYSFFTYCSFDVTKNKHDYYINYMKMFFKDLRKLARKKTNYEKKKKLYH